MTIVRKLLIALGVFVVVLAGLWFWMTRMDSSDRPISATEGPDVTILLPSKETLPTVKILSTVGWGKDEAPQPARGLKVSRFAEGLNHPRTMLLLPNGDVIVAETDHPVDRSKGGGLTARVKRNLYNRAGAGFDPPNALILLRDGDGDGVAEQRFVLRRNDLDSPSGLAWGNGKLYVANHDAVLEWDYAPGDTALAGAPRKLGKLPPAGDHWMRNLLLSQDGKNLYVAIGSASNIGEAGVEAEQYRAAIFEMDVSNGHMRQFAAGLRNPNGMAWNPLTGELWTVVNERDMLGGDLPPDYLTNVPIGAQYGWPWYYWKDRLDERVDAPMPIYLQEYIRKPEYALGAHTAPLGLVFAGEGNRMGARFGNGAFVARHGSWNRNPVSGYDVVFVAFDDRGNPKGMPLPVLTGFIKDSGHVHGRPTWLVFDRTGALLVSDDTAGIVWRVSAPGATPLPAFKPLANTKMSGKRSLDGALEAELKRQYDEITRP